MSPIYTRPIREQMEHDRVIRQLQARYKRKHEVAINPGTERNQAVTVGELELYPDLVLFNPERAKKLEGTVEVETGESVHLLEARAQWGVFSKLKAPFHLYVPIQAIETARRICDEQQFQVTEIWTYHVALDQVRFTQVYRSPHAPKPETATGGKAASAGKAVPKAKAAPPARPAARAASLTKAPLTKPLPKATPKPSIAKAPNSKSALKSAAGKALPAKPAPRVAVKAAPANSSARGPVKASGQTAGNGSVKARPHTLKPAARPTPVKKRR